MMQGKISYKHIHKDLWPEHAATKLVFFMQHTSACPIREPSLVAEPWVLAGEVFAPSV